MNSKQRLASVKAMNDRVKTTCAGYIRATQQFVTLMAATSGLTPTPDEELKLQQAGEA